MSSERTKYLVESVFPDAIKAGRFGTELKFLRFEANNGQIGDQFASSVVFINAILGSEKSNSESTFRLVLKFFPKNLRIREVFNSISQFSNEIAMYSVIFPTLDYDNIIQDLFPTFYWGYNSNNDDKESIVIIEDLRNKKFSLSKFRIYLDYNHIVWALQALGKFHGLSYITKQKKPIEFNKIKDRLVEHIWDKKDNLFSMSIGKTALRGVNAMLEIQYNETLEKIGKKLETNAFELMKQFVSPEEPTAVICHGDFCNHNMLFSYTSDIPTSVKFIDLQTSRYASPVIDLSMLLLLNVEPKLRSSHWDEFISVYYNSVKETVTAAGCVPLSFDQLQSELKNKLFYGYMHCSYFLPLLLSEESQNIEKLVNLAPEVFGQKFSQLGGKQGTQSIVNILSFLQEHDYFNFLD